MKRRTMKPLKGERSAVLITGVAGGMGIASAKRLLETGSTVYGLDLRQPEPMPEGLRFIQTDLTDPASVRQAFEALQREGVRLRAILHMAGLYDLNALTELEEEAWRRIFAVNLDAVYRVNRTFLPLLEPKGRILITTSELAPLDPLPFTGLYAVTKAALDKYASALRMELQLLDLRVIVLRPGAVDTSLLDVSTAKLDAFCANTKRFAPNAQRFRNIVNRVEARKIPPERVAELTVRILEASHPRDVYSINRNPLLLLLNALPNRVQRSIIGKILK
jgi:NAD(P)-dependent dehydrogenase (short-subunit alcohol dehydrogenase family)